MGEATSPAYKQAVIDKARRKRIDSSYNSFEFFVKEYLGHHFDIEPSDLQYLLYEVLSTEEGNRRLVIKAPRGSGKSTLICLAYSLWALATKRKKFIVVIKESDERSRSEIKKISSELESNEKLNKDFPFLSPKRGIRIKRFLKYSSNLIYFQNDTIVASLGKGSAKRGLNEMGLRPDVVIYDDPQGKDEKESSSLRKKDIEAFESEIRFLGGPRASLDIILIGSVIHFECLIQYVANKPGWRSIEIDAIKNEVKKETYWPAVYCYDVEKMLPEEVENWHKRGMPGFENIRTPFYGIVYDEEKNEPWIVGLHEENASIFDQEFRHKPIRSEAMPLRAELWKTFPWTDELVRKLPFRIGALDLSMGKQAGDFQAIGVVGMDNSNNYYLLDGILTRLDLVKSESNEQGLANICIGMMLKYGLSNFMIEDNGAQGLFVNVINRLMQAQNVVCKLRPFKSTTNKIERISNQLGLIIQDGRFHVRSDYQKIRHYAEFLRQFQNFPVGHDDAPDVTNMAVEGLQRMKRK